MGSRSALRRGSPGRRRINLVLVLVVLMAAVACGSPSGGRSEVQSGAGSGEPVSPRLDPALAWTGERIFLYGGSEVQDGTRLNDAHVITQDLAEGETLPEPPFSNGLRNSSVAVTEDTVVVAGTLCGASEPHDQCADGEIAVATFDWATDQWEMVPLPEGLRDISAPQGWIGPTVRVLGPDPDGGVVVDAGPTPGTYWRLDVETSTWSGGVEAPFDLRTMSSRGESPLAGACVTGRDLVVLEVTEELSESSDRALRAVAYSAPINTLDGSAEWTAAEALSLNEWPRLRCAGDLPVITVTTLPYGGVWHLGDGGLRWVAAPDPPALNPQRPGSLDELSIFLTWGWDGEDMVFVNTNGSHPTLRYRPSTMSWTETAAIRSTIETPPLWTGSDFVGVSADGSIPMGVLFTFR
jgi:hypothetical protein